MLACTNVTHTNCHNRHRPSSTVPPRSFRTHMCVDVCAKHVRVYLLPTQVSWGIDLATEHERFLTEDIFKQPVIVYNYPKDIKAFYMKLNEDGKTVAAMDVLVPKVGCGCGMCERVGVGGVGAF